MERRCFIAGQTKENQPFWLSTEIRILDVSLRLRPESATKLPMSDNLREAYFELVMPTLMTPNA